MSIIDLQIGESYLMNNGKVFIIKRMDSHYVSYTGVNCFAAGSCEVDVFKQKAVRRLDGGKPHKEVSRGTD